MVDLVYVASSLAFFALMIAYVAVCERLGRSRESQQALSDTWQSSAEHRV